MKFRHMLVHGLNDLRANKLRHFLVGVSMLLGVLAIAAVSSADQLVTKYLIAEQEQLHGRAQTFASVLNPGTLDGEDLADSLEHLNTVADSVGGNVLYTVSSPITVPSVRGQNIERVAYTGDFAASYRVPLSAGIWPRESGGFAPEVVLNEQAAALLGIDEVAQTFAIDTPHGTKTAIVTGIAQDGLVGEEARIYQPQGSVDDAGLLSSEPSTMLLTAPGDKQIALQQFAADFLTQRGNPSAGSMEFMRQDTVDSTKNSVAVTKAAFLTAGILTLVVAAVGVLNVGLATVGERSEELVIRRALGATKVQIFGLVMGSSMIIGVVVAAISAVIVSVSAIFVVPRFMGTTGLVGGIDLPFGALWFGLVAALITSFLGALSPAIKATKLDVAQALRS